MEHDSAWAEANIPRHLARHLLGEWLMRALPAQYPAGDTKDTWLVTGGRGAGKTRLGAEWVNGLARGRAPFAATVHGRFALIGETLADVREVMIEGPSGIIAGARHDRPRYEAGRRRLLWSNGAVAQAFSSEDPESLRGPQFDAAWCDELAKWKNMDAVWDMLQFGLRLGTRPRQLVTTTPRPVALFKRLLGDPHVTVTRLKTEDNAANLAAGFLEGVRRRYAGTRLGRQELDGELVEDRNGALWTREMIEQAALRQHGTLARIVIGVDPPAGSGKNSDACGIIAAGQDEAGGFAVLADRTVQGAKPQAWAQAAISLYHSLDADCIVAEVNQGGEMVASVLASVDASVPVRMVRATRGKWLRAEPVSALYEQGKVVHQGRFPALEDEMCDFTPAGLSTGKSPDRLDALVWALTDLCARSGKQPRIREI